MTSCAFTACCRNDVCTCLLVFSMLQVLPSLQLMPASLTRLELDSVVGHTCELWCVRGRHPGANGV